MFSVEKCSKCKKAIELLKVLELQECKFCGEYVTPCNYCASMYKSAPCVNCPFEN